MIKHSYAALFFLPLLVAFNLASAQQTKFSQQERRIIAMVDERRNADSLVPLLAAKDEAVAWRAAWGIANIADTSVRSRVISQLSREKRPNVIEAIAFALGVLGESSGATEILVQTASSFPSTEVYDAMGRTTGFSTLPIVLQTIEKSTKNLGVNTLVTIALRKLSSPEVMRLAAIYADAPDPETRWKAAYTFARTEDSGLVAGQIETLKDLLVDLGSPEARMFAASALGRIHSPAAEDLLVKGFRSEKDWRVRVNIVSALSKMPRVSEAVFSVIKRAVSESEKANPVTDHVPMAAFGTLEAMIDAGKLRAQDSAEVRTWLETYLPTSELYPEVSPATRSMIIPLLPKLRSTFVKDALQDFGGYTERAVRDNVVRGIAETQDTTTFLWLLESMAAVGPSEQVIRLEAMKKIWDRAQKNKEFIDYLETRRYANAYRHMVIRISDLVDNPGVVGTALEQVQDSTIVVNQEFRAEANEYVRKNLLRYGYPQYREQLGSALQALGWLRNPVKSDEALLTDLYQRVTDWRDSRLRDTLRNVMKLWGMTLPQLTALAAPVSKIDWEMLESSPDSVLIHTQSGMVFVKLLKHDAPLTVLNFLHLSKIAYFAGNLVHRVVPNFVMQSGDPSATGSGGPGYAIRREISTAKYDKSGMMGMASSGKDTEGSQWFITHSPTPHLDTRYTIFGEVTKGQELIDEIQKFHRIENIVPLRN